MIFYELSDQKIRERRDEGGRRFRAPKIATDEKQWKLPYWQLLVSFIDVPNLTLTQDPEDTVDDDYVIN